MKKLIITGWILFWLIPCITTANEVGKVFLAPNGILNSIKVIKKNDFNLPNNNISGKPVEVIEWADKAGKNILVLTHTGAVRLKNKKNCDDNNCYKAEIFAYHFIKSNGNYKLARRIYDLISGCPFDFYIDFLENSLTVTDLDSNGFAEITFLYKISCRSDITPSMMKLMMLENNVKYALRGSMINQAIIVSIPKERLQSEIEQYGWGKYKIDPTFEKAPEIFLLFAKLRWEQLKIHDEFLQF